MGNFIFLRSCQFTAFMRVSLLYKDKNLLNLPSGKIGIECK
jgi:hypothetical protein